MSAPPPPTHTQTHTRTQTQFGAKKNASPDGRSRGGPHTLRDPVDGEGGGGFIDIKSQ